MFEFDFFNFKHLFMKKPYWIPTQDPSGFIPVKKNGNWKVEIMEINIDYRNFGSIFSTQQRHFSILGLKEGLQ